MANIKLLENIMVGKQLMWSTLYSRLRVLCIQAFLSVFIFEMVGMKYIEGIPMNEELLIMYHHMATKREKGGIRH